MTQFGGQVRLPGADARARRNSVKWGNSGGLVSSSGGLFIGPDGTLSIETGDGTVITGNALVISLDTNSGLAFASNALHVQPVAPLSRTASGVQLGLTVNGGLEVVTDLLKLVDEAPRWRQFTVSHTALQAAAFTSDIELFALPAGSVIQAVKIKQSVAFAGTGISAYTLSVGPAGSLVKYAAAFDVFQAVGATVYAVEANIGGEAHDAATSIRLAATAVGANLDQSTAGDVDVWVQYGAAV